MSLSVLDMEARLVDAHKSCDATAKVLDRLFACRVGMLPPHFREASILLCCDTYPSFEVDVCKRTSTRKMNGLEEFACRAWIGKRTPLDVECDRASRPCRCLVKGGTTGLYAVKQKYGGARLFASRTVGGIPNVPLGSMETGAQPKISSSAVHCQSSSRRRLPTKDGSVCGSFILAVAVL
jgi:hypothetical protein